ncbi:RHS repeat-associated core domain-containing protein, partial [Salinivibrio socompensis]|uniref:RHS repeat-associated core domain-containing protein n=1 Tax=Salinivibrio socompensis TaxID=1510206 RepID=UPI0013E317C9
GDIVWRGEQALWGHYHGQSQRHWQRREEAANDSIQCDLRYQGQLEDPESGLYYNVNRYYDADSGQYLSPDPIGFAGGLRPQAYVANPLEWVDPLGLAGAAHGGEGEDVTNSAARNPANAVKLNKQLGSQQQLGETGVSVAGAGSKTLLRDSKRLANEYGGNTSDWSKRSSLKHTAPDGRKFETHWYENSTTGQRVEPKTIVEDYLKGPK